MKKALFGELFLSNDLDGIFHFPTYTTRSWFEGKVANTGLKVVTNPVNGVAAGQEFWLPNAGWRNPIGQTGSGGLFWASNNGYYMQFGSSYSTGRLYNDNWLYGCPVRCVR